MQNITQVVNAIVEACPRPAKPSHFTHFKWSTGGVSVKFTNDPSEDGAVELPVPVAINAVEAVLQDVYAEVGR